MKNSIIKIVMRGILPGVILFSFTACKKFLETDISKSQVTSEAVFSSDITATSAILGIYNQLKIGSNGFATGNEVSASSLCGLSADELVKFNRSVVTFTEFDQNKLSASNAQVLTLWSSMYKVVYEANAMLDGLQKSTAISGTIKSQLSAEAKFLRAFAYFYLVNLYGDVPLALTSDYTLNTTLPRTSATTVWQQIIADLKDAQSGLPANYLDGVNANSTERARVNKWAATALLARAYLYTGEWQKAATEATTVIGQGTIYSLSPLGNVFLKNSSEAIWQLRPTVTGSNGNVSEAYIFAQSNILNYYVLRSGFARVFETGDMRRSKWIAPFLSGVDTLYRPTKYNQYISDMPLTEYSMVLRLAEQYLVRAEARIQLDDIAGGIADLNVLRTRARGTTPGDLPDLSASLTQADALLKVEQERRVELFTEWGHRWLDLKRRNRATVVLGALKAPDWQETDVLYPLPQAEMNKDINLRPQNTGY